MKKKHEFQHDILEKAEELVRVCDRLRRGKITEAEYIVKKEAISAKFRKLCYREALESNAR